MPEHRQEYTFPNGSSLSCYAHDVLNYRFHRHLQHYEIDIVLAGSLEFVRAGKAYRLKQDDVIIVNPGEGHTTLALEPNTIALVLRFPIGSFRKFLDSEQLCCFHFVSDEATRNEPRFRHLRFYCALLLRSMAAQNSFSPGEIRAEFFLLRSTLFNLFEKEIVSASATNDTFDETIQQIIQYIDENYAKKLSLEELAEKFNYNRTYLSTFFKKNVGIGFYDYLTYVRFNRAVWELSSTSTSLTKVALYNGFPDLKTFNRLFQETFHQTPAEYSQNTLKLLAGKPLGYQHFRDLQDPIIKTKLDEYTCLSD